MAIAGICTGAEERMTKNGKPFGILKVEDYEATHDFFVFGEEYVKHKPYFFEGQYLFIKGKIQPRQWAKDDNDVEFKIASIQLLSEVREKRTKRVIISLPNKTLTTELFEEIEAIIEQHQGNVPFRLMVQDDEHGVVNMNSRTKKVEVSNEFLEKLDSLYQIKYKISES